MWMKSKGISMKKVSTLPVHRLKKKQKELVGIL